MRLTAELIRELGIEEGYESTQGRTSPEGASPNDCGHVEREMMSPALSEILGSAFQANAASTLAAIADAETKLGRLSEGYRTFLLWSNGGEGAVGNSNYLVLWPVEKLWAINRDYEVDLNIPGVILFGSNGGGEAYGFDLSSEGAPIVKVPFAGMSRAAFRFYPHGFAAFLEALSTE